MVALGEYKFRMANQTLGSSKLVFFLQKKSVNTTNIRFFVSRPEKSAVMCGVTIITGKEDIQEESRPIEEDTALSPSVLRNHDDYYYDSP